MTVPANQPWVDTGVAVPTTAGSRFSASYQAWGTIRRTASDPGTTPDGDPNCIAPAGWAAPGLPCGALVGRYGPAGTPFLVGTAASQQDEASPARSATLYLSANDDLGAFGDNTGAWTVNVTFAAAASPAATPTVTPAATATPTPGPTPTTTPAAAATSLPQPVPTTPEATATPTPEPVPTDTSPAQPTPAETPEGTVAPT